MTPEEIAAEWLEDAKHDLEKTGNFIPKAVLIGEREQVVVAIDGNIMNSRTEKSALSKMLRKRCNEIHAHTTVFISDIFFGEMSLEQEAQKRIAEQMLGQSLDVEQCAAAGLCTKREAIMLLIQTKHSSRTIRQAYRRLPGNKIQFEERIELPGKMTGRMANWLDDV